MTTDWENCYRIGQTPWEKGAPAPPLLEWLAQPGHRLTGDVLVPGCGLGHDVRAIARTGDARVVGLDLSAAALEQAESFPKAGSESYMRADLFAWSPKSAGRFDWVFEHTCFCAIDPARRSDYVRAVAGTLRPGGCLLAIFYLRPWAQGEPPPPGGGPPFGIATEELDAFFNADFELIDAWTPTRAYPGREEREQMRLLRRKASEAPAPRVPAQKLLPDD